jgi:hypothetical protein
VTSKQSFLPLPKFESLDHAECVQQRTHSTQAQWTNEGKPEFNHVSDASCPSAILVARVRALRLAIGGHWPNLTRHLLQVISAGSDAARPCVSHHSALYRESGLGGHIPGPGKQTVFEQALAHFG